MVPCLHAGYSYFWFISSKHLYLENLSYIKKQQEQAEAQTKQYHQSSQQLKPVPTFFGCDNLKFFSALHFVPFFH